MAAPGSATRSGNEDEYVTAVASLSSPASDLASEYVNASMETLAAIEKSREQGWSEVADHVREGAAGASSRGLSVEEQLLWENLKVEAPHFFVDRVEGLRWGRLIAVGGQAHIYEAWMASAEEGETSEVSLVAKVFKMEGFSLMDLHRQWPRRKIFPSGSVSKNLPTTTVGGLIFNFQNPRFLFEVKRGFFLEDGRFVFLMNKYVNDLRTFINLKLEENNNQGPPFSFKETIEFMRSIAVGINLLHGEGVLHRDLKAANVLCDYTHTFPHEFIRCKVADYESVMMVQGTGFWRAPEVLEDLLKKPHDRNEEIWTEKVDVYSYAMTCYEVMTGHTPFYGYVKSDWKRVIDGERPYLPKYVDPQLGELVERCWHKEPSQRPTFDAIDRSLRELYVERMFRASVPIRSPR